MPEYVSVLSDETSVKVPAPFVSLTSITAVPAGMTPSEDPLAIVLYVNLLLT